MEKLNFQKENEYLKKKLQELERALTIQAEGIYVWYYRNEKVQGDVLNVMDHIGSYNLNHLKIFVIFLFSLIKNKFRKLVYGIR